MPARALSGDMSYHVVDPDALEPPEGRPSVKRGIGEAVGLANVAVNRYEVDPGEDIPLAFHYHDEQEEVFYVLDGVLGVETPDDEYHVDADEAFVVEPGSPQRAFNPSDADGQLRVLVVGAPAVDDVHAYDPEDG
jgi:uncharacterized cupin superfamily protein